MDYITSIYVIHPIPAIVHAENHGMPLTVRHHRGFGEKALQTRSISTASHEETLPLVFLRWSCGEKLIIFWVGYLLYIRLYICDIFIYIYICLIHSFDDVWWFLSVWRWSIPPDRRFGKKYDFYRGYFLGTLSDRQSIQGLEVSQMSRSIAGTRTRRV